ncbi:MAG: hypothetical protein LQ340_006350, partial [Diploschistes diacapsis]
MPAFEASFGVLSPGLNGVVKKSFMDKVRANIADVKELLLTKDARKPMVLGVFMISMQQLSGIDGVIY